MKIAALAGGVGAARFLSGLAATIAPAELTAIVNTGDDFRWMGLHVSPDLDTIVYTLAGLADPGTGWGMRKDTFHCLDRLDQLGCDPWFRIGDRDLATHVFRTERLAAGESLTEITRAICRRNGIPARILPMTDDPVPTLVHTDAGTLEFQDYFVRRRCEPAVRGFTFSGVESSRPAPGVLDAIAAADAVILCPSNPWISIGPILAVPGIRDALSAASAKTLAVTPIIAGKAVKGPTAAMFVQLGKEVSAAAVAEVYCDFLDVFVLDVRDESLHRGIEAIGIEVRTADTLMNSPEARVALAAAVLGMI